MGREIRCWWETDAKTTRSPRWRKSVVSFQCEVAGTRKGGGGLTTKGKLETPLTSQSQAGLHGRGRKESPEANSPSREGECWDGRGEKAKLTQYLTRRRCKRECPYGTEKGMLQCIGKAERRKEKHNRKL